jgi:hypothetical protein
VLVVPVDLRRLRATGQELVEENVKSLGDLQRQPHLSAGRTNLDRYIEYDRRVPLTLSDTRATRWHSLAVLATLASHQRLLR